MKFSEAWLREWVNPLLTNTQLAEQLTLAGLETVVPTQEGLTLDIQITPNRGDCLSILGIAREVAALNRLDFKWPLIPDITPNSIEVLPIQVATPAACPQYSGRIVRGLNPHAETPAWIKGRLQYSGLHCTHPFVDITHYVLLELGIPFHVFDLNKLSGHIIVREAQSGETLQLLNEKEIYLSSEMLIIADDSKPLALAGIMGGLESAVSLETTDIFIESAFFSPHAIAGRARQYGLNTDASYRFERGIDPKLCQKALERATQLLTRVCGMSVPNPIGPITTITHTQYLSAAQNILLRKARIISLSGIDLPSLTIETYLKRLGLMITPLLRQVNSQTTAKEMVWQVQPPSWRSDIIEEVDLIEEVIRLHGFGQLPNTLPKLPAMLRPSVDNRSQLAQLRHYWACQGFSEVINYSLTSERQLKLLDLNHQPIPLVNPLSAELDVLRTSLWPGLINNALYNQNRQRLRLRFFEIGPVFFESSEEVIEQLCIGGIATASAFPRQWGLPTRDLDFFDIKNTLQNSLSLMGQSENYSFSPSQHPALQPGQSCTILQKGQIMGWLGALHPQILAQYALVGPVYLFECLLANLQLPAKIKTFRPFSRFPSIRRDIAFWVSTDFSLEMILSVVTSSAGTAFVDCRLFDVYQTEDRAQRSLALELIWQHQDRTLTEQEIDQWQKALIHALKTQCDIQLRDK